MEYHNIPPVYDEQSEILILGSFPSVKSRETRFFYGHPQNRFWRILSAIFNDTLPVSIDDKRGFLLKHNIAVWDVIMSCEIEGSADLSIKKVTPNDIKALLEKTNIQKIFANGKTAYNLYNKHILPKTNVEALLLPSSSPANAAYSIDRLIEIWGKAIKD